MRKIMTYGVKTSQRLRFLWLTEKGVRPLGTRMKHTLKQGQGNKSVAELSVLQRLLDLPVVIKTAKGRLLLNVFAVF